MEILDDMDNDYGREMCSLLVEALVEEEAWLHSVLQVHQNRRYAPAIESVRHFDEKWIQYLLVKQSLRHKESPTFETEWKGKTDFIFADRKRKRNLAGFELKGPFWVDIGRTEPRSKYFNEIIEDFRKVNQNKKLETLPKYVVLLPYGQPDDLTNWINNILMPRVTTYLTTSNGPPFATGPLDLNKVDERGTKMLITTFKIGYNGH